MQIIYCDGSILECSEIKIFDNDLYADDCYIVPLCDVEKITD